MTQAQFDMPALNSVDRLLTAVVNTTRPFYRLHPYRKRLWITEVDMRVAVSLQAGFFYNRLPKCANSTVSAVLAHALGSLRLRDATKRPAALSKFEVQRLPDLYKFAVVRDPYARTLSAYLDKIVGQKRQAKRPGRLLKKRFGSDMPSFEQFCLYLRDGGLYDDNHWAPQTQGLLLPVDSYNHIARFERLGEEIAMITQRLFGAPSGAGIRAGPRSDAAAALERNYTVTARNIVRDLYQEDFDLLGYLS